MDIMPICRILTIFAQIFYKISYRTLAQVSFCKGVVEENIVLLNEKCRRNSFDE